MAPASELVRITRAADGDLSVGAGPGRGAWLCAGSPACFEAAVQRQALGRALQAPVTAIEADALRAKLEKESGVASVSERSSPTSERPWPGYPGPQ